jgi:U3 small nucleolar RNA-associated protein 14
VLALNASRGFGGAAAALDGAVSEGGTARRPAKKLLAKGARAGADSTEGEEEAKVGAGRRDGNDDAAGLISTPSASASNESREEEERAESEADGDDAGTSDDDDDDNDDDETEPAPGADRITPDEAGPPALDAPTEADTAEAAPPCDDDDDDGAAFT